ncbi:hypothetical protein L3Q82_020137 [Scortum barcoo]|uniref:Uncharacterized protein n=1 Tax=Scortum barcoo TaxID=214431 RepID=A0ACB8VAX8_9TELE|nr:hypothetical protein L3Q82_020137 [Scortum barcoo]
MSMDVRHLCRHIRSATYTTSSAKAELLSPHVLDEMVAAKWFGRGEKEDCLKRQELAHNSNAPLSVHTIGKPDSKKFISVYEPAVSNSSGIERVMVVYDTKTNTWTCPCADPARSCVHKDVGKWHLFQTQRILFGPARSAEEVVTENAEEDERDRKEDSCAVNTPEMLPEDVGHPVPHGEPHMDPSGPGDTEGGAPDDSQQEEQAKCYLCVLRQAEIKRLLDENRALRLFLFSSDGGFGTQKIFLKHKQKTMKAKEKQREKLTVSTKMKKTMKNVAASSSDDEDSDVEKNFALLTERGRGAEEEEQDCGGEEDFSDDDEEEEEDGSDVGEEEEEEDEEGSDAGEEESDGGEEEDEDDPEDAGGSSEIQTREDIKNELSNMSFEDIMKLQNKVGTKVYNEVAYGSKKSSESRKKKRLNKNRPMEISAKRPAPFLRQVVPVRKATLRDPRFDDLSGEYKPEIFEKTYKFINDIKQREKEVVQKQLKKTKKNKRKEKLQFLLKRMENQERARKSREQQRERELQFKRQQRERASQGARPFFFKSSEKKKLQLAEKYQELKKSGKLENFLSKKRKRNAGKDRRKLPRQLHM